MSKSLTTLTLFYSKKAAHSHGARIFVDQYLPTFAKLNPQLVIKTVEDPSKSSHITGEYANGYHRTASLANMDSKEIMDQVMLLRNSLGRRTTRFYKRTFTDNPSIQGVWHPMIHTEGTVHERETVERVSVTNKNAEKEEVEEFDIVDVLKKAGYTVHNEAAETSAKQ
eukprot:TRINITY_DN629_c0_g1_i1.p1 TRINITY_DN629_c0_g1~~TRINITY_DN629_c0_g1_i1.p1  ORF type:complete len:168 (-),score=43.08 TRINITY_DN629_c0_g1_i1:79-582(-)